MLVCGTTVEGSVKSKTALIAFISATLALASVAAQAETQYPRPTELPNPYRLVEGWPTIPKSMNGGHWGEVIRVHVAPNGNIWVFHRCFNTVPPGHATCIRSRRLQSADFGIRSLGQAAKSFGAGLFAYPHGFTIDGQGNLWVTDVNDEATVLGMSAKNADGVIMGQEVLKLSPAGKVLMTLGKEGVSGNGPDTFDRPTGVAVGPNGDVFVTDGHAPNRAQQCARGEIYRGTASSSRPGDTKERRPAISTSPTTSSSAGPQGRVYVADRRNNARIQVFDQDGNFIAAWKQFGQPSSVFVGKDDTIYVGAAFPDPAPKKASCGASWWANAKDGSLKAFIPDPADPDKLDVGTSASGIAADAAGSIYAADVAAHNLRKYVKTK